MGSTAPLNISYFTGFDWLLIVLVVWSTLAGFKRGLARAVLGLLGLVGGCLLASDYNREFGRVLAGWIQPFATARIVAFLVIAIVVWALFTLVGGSVKEKLKKLGLGMPDRVLGALFGLARGLLLGVSCMLAVTAMSPGASIMAGSRVAPYFLEGAHEVSFLIPYDLQSLIHVPGRYRTVE